MTQAIAQHPPADASAPARASSAAGRTGQTSIGARITDPAVWAQRMREALDRCAACGCRRVALYGCGTHTKALSALYESPPVHIVCFIDDGAPAEGARYYGYPVVQRSQALSLGLDAVILSANSFEDQLWERASVFREAGLPVVRLYDDPGLKPTDAGAASASFDVDHGATLDAEGLPVKGAHVLFPVDAYRMLARFLDAQGSHVFIDAGANAGHVTARLRQVFPNATIHSFEPVEETFEGLRQRFADDRLVRPVRAALGPRTQDTTIHVNGCPGTSSLLASNQRNIAYHGDKTRTVREERVRCFALDDWARGAGVGRVDFIKIDVQGLELELLKGARGLLESSVKAVYSEAQMVEHYEGAAMFSDIDLYLRSLGFELFQIHQIFSDGLEQRTCCCDALWLKKGEIERYADERRAAYQSMFPSDGALGLNDEIELRRIKASPRTDAQVFDLGFHGDADLIALASGCLRDAEVFIETGSNVGNTLRYVAERYPGIRCYSCEPGTDSYHEASKRTRHLSNVDLREAVSPGFLESLLQEDPALTARRAVFFLDAHGYGFDWPLEDEVKLITRRFERACIIIDDLLVPGKPQFKFDRYRSHLCSVDAIRGAFAPGRAYQILYPAYQNRSSPHHPLVGYGVVYYGGEDPDLSPSAMARFERLTMSL